MRNLWLIVFCVVLTTTAVFAKPRPYKGYYYVPYDAQRMHFGLTPQEAEQRLVRWINNPAVSLRFIGVGTSNRDKLENRTSWPVYDPTSPPGRGLSYLFEDNLGKLYIVAIVPIEMWKYRDIEAEMTPYDPEDPSTWLPEEQRDAIARQFIAARLPNFLEGEHRIARKRVVYRLYQGLGHNRYISVSVHPTLGVVESCEWYNPGEPVGLHTNPTLSQEQARQLALAYAYQLEEGVVNAEIRNPPALGIFSDVLGITRLMWWMTMDLAVVAYPGDNLWTARRLIIGIDAHTGDVVDFDRFVSSSAVKSQVASPSKKPSKPMLRFEPIQAYFEGSSLRLATLPPLRVGKTAYVWVGWLKLPLYEKARVSIAYASGAIQIDYNGQRWLARVGSNQLSRDGISRRLSAPVLNIRGRVYLPAEALEVIAGMKMRSDDYTLYISR
ncbi:MAG: hypothetical protein K6U75_16225 [Firmicutes bacterium]|nr:hypothetical protein [Bacillota bacterium]